MTTSQSPQQGQPPANYPQPGQYGPPPGGYPPPPQQPLPRKKRRWPWIVGGLAVLIVLGSMLGGGNQPATPAAAPAQPQQPAAQQPSDSAGGDVITYEVTGTGSASNVTYVKDKNMGQEQLASAKLPWSKQVTFEGGVLSFQPLSLVAQNGQSGGDLTCRILRNGQELTSSTSSGPFAVVTCSAS